MTEPREPDSITFADVIAARTRLQGTVPRSPLIRLEREGPGELYLKLENLQPIRSFKLRGASNAMALLDDAQLAAGVYTASAGNMAQGVAWSARRRPSQPRPRDRFSTRASPFTRVSRAPEVGSPMSASGSTGHPPIASA